jgi:hypothetical protein
METKDRLIKSDKAVDSQLLSQVDRYDELSIFESYRKRAALSVMMLVAGFVLISRETQSFFIALVPMMALASSYFIYRGRVWAMVLGGAIWTIAILAVQMNQNATQNGQYLWIADILLIMCLMSLWRAYQVEALRSRQKL